ncbi:MAG: thioredoxin domain-containing protein, partial [Marinoscillum sp.]
MSKTYNSLIKEKSPYLLQHSTNPVNWKKWSEKTLLKAKKEDKLIILSIGYSTCHWCHVMEKESFKNIKIAEIMNKYFICIKVDREERPDIDSIYMDAIQSMGIQGGWPLNLFLTPNKKPFYGGTYFNKESWFKILINIIEAYKKHKNKIIKSSNNFSKNLNRTHDEKYSTKNKFSISALINEIKIKFDYKEGGISKSPKFPMPNLWKSLLFYSLENKDKKVYSHVIKTIDKILEGGIYDQIEGGFSRYSVDEKWIIPHFEKMLYDNGQLLDLYADIFKITKNEKYLHIINNTINWLKNNMTDKSGGFYSAIDADSEGEEGKYYIWKYHEIKKILGNLTAKACKVFKITKKGNWNNHNILLRDYKQEIESKNLNRITKKLLLERNKRIKPLIDNKIISSWNAITLIGLLNCYQATNDNKILELATKNAKFIKDKLITKSTITRVYKNKIGGFLDDYAYVINSFIKYFETTQNFTYLNKARELIEETIKNFYCPKNKLFYYTSNTSEKLISRKIEIFDSV